MYNLSDGEEDNYEDGALGGSSVRDDFDSGLLSDEDLQDDDDLEAASGSKSMFFFFLITLQLVPLYDGFRYFSAED